MLAHGHRSLPRLRERKITRTHWRPIPAITSIVRDLCRRRVSIRVKSNGCSGRNRTSTLRVTTGWTTIIRLSSEIGAPGGTCTHILPADNGLLFYSATEAKWWEALVMLQSSLPVYLTTPDLQSGNRITSHEGGLPSRSSKRWDLYSGGRARLRPRIASSEGW